MAFCSLAGEAAIFASTPVDNLFIQEYMLRAPGDYVKVYIYGLMQSIYPSTAEPTIEKFASALCMDKQVVNDAFNYWKRKRLVREQKDKAESLIFLDLRGSMLNASNSVLDNRLFDYAELNNQITQAAKQRVFTPRELDMIYDWIEIFGLSHETVILLIEHCTKTLKKRAIIERMDATAREWHKNNIKTAEQAREYLLGIDLRNSPANKILTTIGVSYRNVTHDEHLLFEKWTQEWGFPMDAIRQVCAGMTGVQNPNFKYLDKILNDYHERGLHSSRAISENINSGDILRAKVQKIAYQLGVRTITQEHIRFYNLWKVEYGMDDDAILMACKETSSQGNGSFKLAESTIASYSRRSLKTVDAIKKDRLLDQDALRLFEALGFKRKPTEADKAQLVEWQASLPFEVILQGASYCLDAKRPLGLLKRILEQWKEKNISTVTQAKKEHDEHMESYPKSANQAVVPMHKSKTDRDFEQREYDEKDLNALFDDLSNQ